MAHETCTICTCGHIDHKHTASKPHACRVRGCSCTFFVAVEPDLLPNRTTNRKEPNPWTSPSPSRS